MPQAASLKTACCPANTFNEGESQTSSASPSIETENLDTVLSPKSSLEGEFDTSLKASGKLPSPPAPRRAARALCSALEHPPVQLATNGLCILNEDRTGGHPLKILTPRVFSPSDSSGISRFFWEEGFVVVKDVSKQEDRRALIARMDQVAGNPASRRLGFMDIYHDDALAQLRQNPVLYGVFAALYGTKQLWSVFDRVMYWQSDEGEQPLPPHVDQNPHTDPDFGHIQAILALRPMNEGTGTLALVPQSTKIFPQYKAWAGTKDGFVNYQGTGQLPFVALRLAEGEIVLWDSRTTHSRYRGVATSNRYGALITYKPAVNCVTLREKRLAYYEAGTGVNDHAAGLRATAPPRWSDSGRQDPERLTELGKYLYGTEDWFA